jgi:uncharacterized caspase-like protein
VSRYALVIGNKEYTDPGLAKLTAPGKDAEAFARVLASKELCGFEDVQVLMDQPEPVVREAIDGFFDQKKSDDLLVLYFSGHGVRDEYGSLYLAVRNTNRLRLRATAIKSDFIRESMDQSRSRRQVLILDCCNSGAFAQGTKAATGVSIGTASAFEGTGYGRIVLTASDSTQFAWEGDKVIGETENSLFTHFLVKGLRGEADRDGDGRITVDELYDYAYEQILSVTPKQTPGKWSYKQQGEILLRQSTRLEDVKPVQLPDELIEEAEDTRPYVRDAAVQKLIKILQGKNIGLQRSAQAALEKIASDEDTTRRVAQEAANALEDFRQAQQLAIGNRASEENAQPRSTPIIDEGRRADEQAAAKLRGREVTEQLSRQQARQAIHEKSRRGNESGSLLLEGMPASRGLSPQKIPWRPVGMAGIAILAILLAGYTGLKFLPHAETPATVAPATDNPSNPTSLPVGPGSIPFSTLETGSATYSLAFSPDGRTLASGLSDNEIILWDTASHQPLGEPLNGHSDSVHALAFSPDGKTLASGSYDNSIILWDLTTHKAIGQPLEGHRDSVFGLAFSPDEKGLVSGSRDKTIVAWDLQTRKIIATVHTGPVESIAFSPDGSILASGDDDGNVILWRTDVSRQQPTGTVLSGHTGAVFDVAFSPEGEHWHRAVTTTRSSCGM